MRVLGNYFTFNGVNSAAYGIRISGERTFGAPERDETVVSIPGKNGDVVLDNGRWKNRTVVYECSIAKNFAENFSSFRSAIMASPGYHHLEETYHPDEFYIARISGPIEPNVNIPMNVGSFTLTFDRKPQRFLKSGEHEVEGTSPLFIYNPTLYASKPLIRVYCGSSDNVKLLAVNSTTYDTGIVVYPYPVLEEALSEEDFEEALESGLYVDIDCDIGEAYGVYYSDGVATTINLNAAVSLAPGTDFPKLTPGENKINTTGDGLVITPRWYTI